MRPVQAAPAPDQYLISPITGEKIPAEKVQEHMRIGKKMHFFFHYLAILSLINKQKGLGRNVMVI